MLTTFNLLPAPQTSDILAIKSLLESNLSLETKQTTFIFLLEESSIPVINYFTNKFTQDGLQIAKLLCPDNPQPLFNFICAYLPQAAIFVLNKLDIETIKAIINQRNAQGLTSLEVFFNKPTLEYAAIHDLALILYQHNLFLCKTETELAVKLLKLTDADFKRRIYIYIKLKLHNTYLSVNASINELINAAGRATLFALKILGNDQEQWPRFLNALDNFDNQIQLRLIEHKNYQTHLQNLQQSFLKYVQELSETQSTWRKKLKDKFRVNSINQAIMEFYNCIFAEHQKSQATINAYNATLQKCQKTYGFINFLALANIEVATINPNHEAMELGEIVLKSLTTSTTNDTTLTSQLQRIIKLLDYTTEVLLYLLSNNQSSMSYIDAIKKNAVVPALFSNNGQMISSMAYAEQQITALEGFENFEDFEDSEDPEYFEDPNDSKYSKDLENFDNSSLNYQNKRLKQ